MGDHSVVQNAAHAAHLHFSGSTVTTSADLRLSVHATVFLIAVMPLDPDSPPFTPSWAPGILHEPVLTTVFTEANERYGMVNHRIQWATVEDSR
eukprot:CAMPEP_0172709316 /NCGR_PEP_ID=MMETSP1074-20121228/54113_1 /TAXON_ID=2916 /ORGANISM="Ceratium fusus, Strain PA161109" /LENGTH=93 /DNA_ID=CAMNT_0013532519 /DNA_START=67 /DNA_END=348 /DNA_ORIENTATION=+